jgi:uncharacterized protein
MDMKKWIVPAGIILITLLCYFPLRNLRYDFSIEKFFPKNDTDLVFFENFKERFQAQTDDEYIFIALSNSNGIFNKSFLEKTDSLTRYIAGLENIRNVYSITGLSYYYFKDGRIIQEPLIHILQEDKHIKDSLRLINSEEYKKLLLSKDLKTIAISAFNEIGLDPFQKDEIINGINQKIKELNFGRSHFTAKIVVEKTYVAETEKNLKKYLLASFLIIFITLFILFRSIKEILLPIASIIIAITWTLAITASFHYPLDVISSLLPPILAVICMSNVIHISFKFREELKASLSKEEALKKTFKEIGLATFLTSLTTAIGFFSLCITDILPIKMFGFFAGIGVLLSFIITAGFTWSVYVGFSSISTGGWVKSNTWNSFLTNLLLTLLKHKKTVLSIMVVMMIAAIYFIGKIQINSSLLQEIPRENPVLKDFHFIEENFSGTRPFEMELVLKDTADSFLNIDALKEINEIENFIENSCGVGFLISPLTFIKSANKIFSEREGFGYVLPDSQEELNQHLHYISISSQGHEILKYLTSDGKNLRLSGRLPDISTKEFEVLKDKIDKFFRVNKKSINYKVTGSSVLFDKIPYSLINNMFYGITIGLVFISLLGFILFRSFQMALIILIPNLIPLLFMAAVMGAFGILLKADTSIVFAIALGIAIDDTIHFISRFKIELSKGRTVPYAVKRTFLTTGKAIVVTTIILASGFMTLLLSSFGGTFYIGLLVSLSLAFAMLADLTFVPLLLLVFYRHK